MFSRFRVRTKLLAIALPGVICAGVLGGVVVSQRLDDSARAQHVLAVSNSLRAADRFVQQLQVERALQVEEEIRHPARPSAALSQQIQATTAAGRSLASSLDELRSVPAPADGDQLSGDIVASMDNSVRGLNPLRFDAVDNSSPAAKLAGYTKLIDPLLAASRGLGFLDHDLSRDAMALHWLSEATEVDSQRGAHAMVSLAEARSGIEPSASVDADLGAALATKLDSFKGSATASTAQKVTNLTADPTFVAAAPGAASSEAIPVSGDLADQDTAWVEPLRAASTGRTDALHGVGREILDAQQRSATQLAAAAHAEMVRVLALLAASLAVVVGLALALAARMGGALRSMSRAAREISERQLPTMVESLRGNTDTSVQFPRIDTSRGDEFGDVARALDGLGRMASVVTARQSSAVRKGIGEIFVNLARRNQLLLDRQIEFIDRLESNEEDPDQLDKLFKLDHLATRMRRNAESLLVLAGAETPRDRGRQIAVTDVIRVAIGEVEDFDRVVMSTVDEVSVNGGAAADLAHLLSELMENGTQFSAPDRAVDVYGILDEQGRYCVSISDQGIGMPTTTLAAVNELLASPPPLGLSMSRSLGFVVVSTLAARHGIKVSAAAHRPGTGLVGTTFTVIIPANLVINPHSPTTSGRKGWTPDGEYVDHSAMFATESPHGDERGADGAELEVSAVEVTVTRVAREPAHNAPLVDASWWFPELTPDTPVPSRLDDRLPEGEAFDAGLYSLLDREPPEIGPDGLPQRRPGAALGPTATAAASVVAPARHPDEIRSVLSRYRRGLAAGRTADDIDAGTDAATPIPTSEEASDG